MVLILISVIRYLVSGLFIFSIFNNSKNSAFAKIIAPSLIYTFLLISFKVFVMDTPIITLVSFTAIFGYLLLKNKLKTWKFTLTYSLFVTCLLEYSHFLIFKIVSIVRDVLKIPEVTYATPVNLLIVRIIIFLLYLAILFTIYKFNLVDIKVISKLSDYKVVTMFLNVIFGIIIYLKYYIKYTDSNELHNILSVVFVFFIIVSLVFISSSKIFLKKIEKSKVNPALEEAKLQKGKQSDGIKFISQKFNIEMQYFQDVLSKMGMNKDNLKTKQISYAAVLLKYEENPENVSMRSKIYPCIADILILQPKSVESNISNALQNHWNSIDATVMKKREENYHGTLSSDNGVPTPKEFLQYLIKEANESKNITFKNKIIFRK